MTDDRTELDKLRRAMAANPAPAPRDAARKTAMQAALRAFDKEHTEQKSEKNAAAAQGSADGNRLTPDRANWFGDLMRRLTMTFGYTRLKPVLVGGTSLAAIAVAVVVTQKGFETPGFLDDLIKGAEKAEVTDGMVTKPADVKDEVFGRFSPPVERADNDDRAVLLAEENVAQPAPKSLALQDKKEDAPAIQIDQSGRVRTIFEPSRKVRRAQNAPAEPEADAVMAAPATGAIQAEGRTRIGGLVSQSQQLSGTVGGYAASEAPAAPPLPALTLADQEAPTPGYQDQGRDRFEEIEPNPIQVTMENPVSTFSIDVDTASYAFMRKSLMQGVLPQKDAVRVEELINYFPYDYQAPENAETPFNVDIAVLSTPWNEGTKLMRIGIKGYEIPDVEKPRSNLVFLLDTSGSMNAPDKLPLLKNSFKLLLDSLEPEDSVAIVAYAGSAGTVLEPTSASEKGKILAALERLSAGGSTAGGEGIRQAYRLAEQSFDKDGVNRVILATDGDFNVGIRNTEELKGFIERKRETGVFLSILGFGRGNYNDQLMQALAQNGNGQAAYIDTLSEARKVLVDEASSTLFPIAKDVKIQVEFNPATVAEYRLIGYETRALAREDFNNDKVDAGEIGAGHRVTALYEITPVGSAARAVDDLRYQPAEAAERIAGPEGEYAFVKIRYKQPDSDTSELITRPVIPHDEDALDGIRLQEARFAVAVAAYGQLLRGGRHLGDFGYDEVIALGQSAKGDDPYGYRAEFLNLARLAKSAAALDPQRR